MKQVFCSGCKGDLSLCWFTRETQLTARDLANCAIPARCLSFPFVDGIKLVEAYFPHMVRGLHRTNQPSVAA
jgi:hypothetical protein